MEASTRFELVNHGFANRSLKPLGYDANSVMRIYSVCKIRQVFSPRLSDMQKPKLSVAIITFQEADRIVRCLKSVQFADEVVVVDSGSTDQTKHLALKMGVKWIEHPFHGHVSQKNLALSHCSHDWVLCIDADEWVSPMLADGIQNWLRVNQSASGLKVIRKNLWLGRLTRFGVFGQATILRLVKKSKATWDGQNPHDYLTVDGVVEESPAVLWHDPYRSFQEHIQTVDRYAAIASRSLQPSLWRLLVRPPSHFLRAYVLKLGFLDGFVGLILACLGSYYVWLKYWRSLRS